MLEGDGSLEKELAIDTIIGEKIEVIAPVTSPSLDFNDNEDIPTELSDSSDTHDEGGHLKMGAQWPFLSPFGKAKGMSQYGDRSQSLGSWGKSGWVTAFILSTFIIGVDPLSCIGRNLSIPRLSFFAQQIMLCSAI